MASVQLEGVRKEYENGFVAVHDATFEVADGEFVVLVGPSGCGKSTTLRMIAGLESITRGTLRIGGRVVNAVPANARDIAMVFQNYALYPHMTVYENMAFALKLRNTPRAEIDQRVRDAAKLLGLETSLARKPRQLSGGQRQRVAVGRAIVRHPEVFLFDEPLSNLDAKLRVQTRKEISRLHRQLDATMIYVTHDQVEAMTMGNRIVVMSAGQIQQIGTPLELYHTPNNLFVAGFIGSPAMNLFHGHLRSEQGKLFFQDKEDGLRINLSDLPKRVDLERDGEIVLGVRPEAIYHAEGPYVPKPGSELHARVDVVEPMGNEIFLYATVGQHEIVARVSPDPVPEPDTEITLSIDLRKLHFFEAASGERLF
jgi:multiple sugar transport system ATP-binding protein